MSKIKDFYVEYPFPLVLPPHPQLLKAFPRSELEPVQISGLLQGFVIGARLSELTRASFIYRGEVKPFPDSEWRPPTNGEGAVLKPISEAAIRARFKRWRELIFSKSASARHYLDALKRNATYLGQDERVLDSAVEFFEYLGLFDDLDASKRQAREEVWEEIQFCIRKCPAGLTTGKFVSKTNGHTYYQAALANWRIFLEQVDGVYSFQREVEEHRDESNRSFESLREQIKRKESCGHCTRKFFTLFDMPTTHSIFEFVSRHRAGSIREFYFIFSHAVTVGLLHRELVRGMMEQSRSHSNWVIVPDAQKRRWHKRLYDIDTNFQQCLSSAAFEIVELELDSQRA